MQLAISKKPPIIDDFISCNNSMSLSKVIHSVLSEVAHPYYVVFGGCRERGKRTIFAVGTGALQKTCFELQPGICLGIATKLLYGLV